MPTLLTGLPIAIPPISGGGGGAPGLSALEVADAEIAASVTAIDEDATGVIISTTPINNGMVFAVLNGNILTVGNGVKTKECYFADPATPGVARAISAIVAGDSLRWMGSIATYQLSASDIFSLIYAV